MKFRPLHDRVVVRPLEADEKSKGGIIIPDTARGKPQEGEIIAAGPGARDASGKLTPQDAASIAGLLVTTEVMIAERPQNDAAPAMPGGHMGH